MSMLNHRLTGRDPDGTGGTEDAAAGEEITEGTEDFHGKAKAVSRQREDCKKEG